MEAKDLFDVNLVFTNIPDILRFLPVTMELALGAMAFSLIFGLSIALIRIKRVRVLSQIAAVFISVIRGTPILVQLYVTYYGIPMFLKYLNLKYGTAYNINNVPAILYAFVALAINESVYCS